MIGTVKDTRFSVIIVNMNSSAMLTGLGLDRQVSRSGTKSAKVGQAAGLK